MDSSGLDMLREITVSIVDVLLQSLLHHLAMDLGTMTLAISLRGAIIVLGLSDQLKTLDLCQCCDGVMLERPGHSCIELVAIDAMGAAVSIVLFVLSADPGFLIGATREIKTCVIPACSIVERGAPLAIDQHLVVIGAAILPAVKAVRAERYRLVGDGGHVSDPPHRRWQRKLSRAIS